ncbi:MAG: hypothetical protein J6Z31_06995 [Fibrobacter sp.]|nr:hypothetical protein [Fibrobacter sp.]
MKPLHILAFTGIASFFLTACVGTSPQPSSALEPPTEPSPVAKDSTLKENSEVFRPVVPSAFAKDDAPASEPVKVQDSEPVAQKIEAEEIPDIYVEIPRLAQMALTRADSFYAAGELDSAAAIVERFSVLNPLWKEWQVQAKSISEKVRSGYSKKDADLQRYLIALVNANSRRAPYSEVKPIVDTIFATSPSDSIRHLTDSLSKIAYVRTYEKVKMVRDEALLLAREKAAFDAAEQKLSDLILRYSDFIDTLELQNAVLKISSLRIETSASAEFWQSHDPKKALEEAKQLSASNKWQAAKEALQKLKSSHLRGESLRELDSLNTRFCTEKRKLAAALFAESKNKKANKSDKLSKAIAELDACLEFAPDYKERATVLSNKQFLQMELAK